MPFKTFLPFNMVAAIPNFFQVIRKRRFYRYGIPFLILTVGGSFGLRQFTHLRYQFTKREMLTKEQADQIGIKREKELPSLEEEYKKNEENVDLDNWQNIRGPRPWEDSKSFQQLEKQMAQIENVST